MLRRFDSAPCQCSWQMLLRQSNAVKERVMRLQAAYQGGHGDSAVSDAQSCLPALQLLQQRPKAGCLVHGQAVYLPRCTYKSYFCQTLPHGCASGMTTERLHMWQP